MEYSDRFSNFWAKYSANNKGPKRKAYETWNKVCKAWCKEEKLDSTDEIAFSQHVARGYDAVSRNRDAQHKARQFVPVLPHVTTWLNQYRFEEEFETSTGELKRQAVERVCDCGSTDVFGRNADMGWTCRECDIVEWKAGNTYMGYIPTLEPLVKQYPRQTGEDWRHWSIRVMGHWPAGRKLLERYG